jgi:hypothetical protein
VYRAEIAKRVPHGVGLSVERNILVNGSHDDLFLQALRTIAGQAVIASEAKQSMCAA